MCSRPVCSPVGSTKEKLHSGARLGCSMSKHSSQKSESNVEFPTSFFISKETNTRYCTHLHCGRLHHMMPQKGVHSQNKGYSYSAWLDSTSHHDVPSIGVKILCLGSGSWSGAPTSRLFFLTDTLTLRSHVLTLLISAP